MNKRRNAGAILFVIPFLAACLGADFPVATGWMSLHVSPLEKKADQTITFTYRQSAIRNGQKVEFQIYLQNEFYPDKLLVFQEIVTVNLGINDIVREYILFAGFVSEGPNNLSFEATADRLTKKISFDAYYKTRSAILSDENGLKSYDSPYNEIILDQGILYKKRDAYQFSGFYETLESEYYHHLNLEGLSFFSENNFTYKKAILMIKDDFGFYKRLNRSLAIGYREFPLWINYEGENTYRFSYGANLFVDPATLLMSLSSRDGFVPTNTFYFPKEHYEDEKDIEMEIVITDCGINENTIIYKFTYFSYLRFLGDCRDSQYCVNTSTCSDESVFEEWDSYNL